MKIENVSHLNINFLKNLMEYKKILQEILKCCKNKDYNSKYLLLKKRGELINKTFQHIGL